MWGSAKKASWVRSLPRGFWEEAAAARRVGRALPKRFVIFAQGRTGSTLLTSLLDSHSTIRCEDELLELPRVAPVAFVENRARGARAPWFGFHVKSYQLTENQRVRDLDAFLRGLDGRGWKIVHLYRENVFSQVVSTLYAKRSGRYHFRTTDGEARPGAVTLDAEKLIRKMEFRASMLKAEFRALEGLDHIRITYERDLIDERGRNAALDRVQDFLGVPRERLSTELRKSVNRPLSSIIANYDEVAAAVRATSFAVHLPPEAAA